MDKSTQFNWSTSDKSLCPSELKKDNIRIEWNILSNKYHGAMRKVQIIRNLTEHLGLNSWTVSHLYFLIRVSYAEEDCKLTEVGSSD